MLDSHKKIFETHIKPTGFTISSLPLRHAGLAPLRKAGVRIAGIDERYVPQEWGEGVSRTHLLFFVTDGRANYTAAESSITVGPGELIIVPGKVAKRLSIAGEGMLRALWFHLLDTPAWAHLRTDHASVRVAGHLHILDAAQRQLLLECRYDDAVAVESCLILSRLIINYLTLEVCQQTSVERERMQVILQSLWAQVNAHPEHEWVVPELAAIAGISPGHFHRVVREQQKASPMDIVARIRMEHAAVLLRTTDWTLDRIASSVGYVSQYAFSHAFLRYAGMRPGAFRRQ